MKLEQEQIVAFRPALCRQLRARGFSREDSEDSEDSEDIAQETLLRVWRRGRVFEGVTHLRRYVFIAARHVATNAWRRTRRTDGLDQLRCDTMDPAQALQAAELEFALRDRLQTIDSTVAAFLDPDSEPPAYRRAAERAGMRVGALRTAVCRGRQRLRRELCDLLAA